MPYLLLCPKYCLFVQCLTGRTIRRWQTQEISTPVSPFLVLHICSEESPEVFKPAPNTSTDPWSMNGSTALIWRARCTRGVWWRFLPMRLSLYQEWAQGACIGTLCLAYGFWLDAVWILQSYNFNGNGFDFYIV